MIFRCSWYNEDAYGPMESVFCIVQAKDAAEAKLAVESEIKTLYPDFDFTHYEKFSCTDVSNETILQCDISCI